MIRIALPGLLAALTSLCTASAEAQTFAEFQGDALAYYDAAVSPELRTSNLRPLLQGRPSWSVVADVAALGRAEKKTWRLQRAECLPPVYARCLLFLAEPGKPGTLLREYDTAARRFVDDGFALPSGPTEAAWYDDGRIMVAADTGPGTLTSRGAPRLLKLWTRGEPIYSATTILALPLDAAAVRPIFSLSGGGLFHAAEVTTASGDKDLYHFGWAQNFRRSSLPAKSAFLDFFQGRSVALMRDNWTFAGRRFPAGSLVAYPMAPLLGPAGRTLPELAYLPPVGTGVVTAKAGRDALYVQLRGPAGDRLVSIRKGAPDWPATDIVVPGEGPMSLLAASSLADVALVARGSGAARRLFIAGHGRTREVAP